MINPHAHPPLTPNRDAHAQPELVLLYLSEGFLPQPCRALPAQARPHPGPTLQPLHAMRTNELASWGSMSKSIACVGCKLQWGLNNNNRFRDIYNRLVWLCGSI